MRSDYTEVKVIDEGKEENPLFDQRLNHASGDLKPYSLEAFREEYYEESMKKVIFVGTINPHCIKAFGL